MSQSFHQPFSAATTPTRPPPPSRPTTPAHADPPTLYQHGTSLHITRDMTAAQALHAIAAWSAAIPGGMEAMVHRVPVVAEGKPGADRDTCAAVVRELRGKLCRDLMVVDPAAVTGKTLLLTGLLVPVEVCSMQPHHEHAHCVVLDLLVKTAPDTELRMGYQLPKLSNAPLDTQDAVDVMYALAPALAALFHAHDVTPDRVPTQLGRAGVRPRVPACIMQPAERAPCQGLNKDACVAECMMYAQHALQRCGYHVPDLGSVALVEAATLGTWLRTHVAGLYDAAKMEEEVLPELRALVHDLERMQQRVQAVQAHVNRLRRTLMMPMPMP